jgi:PII-like signaling protein
MQLDRDSKLLRIFIGEFDKYRGKPLYEALVEQARQDGIAGATVLRGILSYGASTRVHRAKLIELSADLPIIVEIVDSEPKIDSYLNAVNPILEEANCGALITIEKAEVIRYQHHK